MSNLLGRLSAKAWRISLAGGLDPSTFLKTRLTPALRADLAQMRVDSAASDPNYRAGPIWDRIGRSFEAWFAIEGIGEVENQTLNGLFSNALPGNPKLLRYACWMLYRDILARDRAQLLNIPATAAVDAGLAFRFGDHLVSWDQLISIDTIYAMADADPRLLTEKVIVGEIGAGWGRIGYILKKANPLATYVALDLPETLLVSQTHLPRRLPGERILTYAEARDIPLNRETLGQRGCAFLGAHDLPRIADGTFDGFLNIASFQEMSRAQVSNYMAQIDRTLCGTLFLQQLRASGTHGYDVGEIGGLDEYDFPPKWRSVRLTNSTWSDLYFDAVFQVNASSRRSARA